MSLSKNPHTVDVESIQATKRNTPNRKPKAVAARQQSEQEQETRQEPRSIKEAFIRMLPIDFPTVLRAFVTLACLYEFFRTGNVTMLFTAYALANGVPSLKAILPYKKGALAEEEKAA